MVYKPEAKVPLGYIFLGVVALVWFVWLIAHTTNEQRQRAEETIIAQQEEAEIQRKEAARKDAIKRIKFTVDYERPRVGHDDYEDYYVFSWKIKNITSTYLKIQVSETDSTLDIGKAKTYIVSAGLAPGKTVEHSREVGTGGQYCKLSGTSPGLQGNASASWTITSQSGGYDSNYSLYLDEATPISKELAMDTEFSVDESDSFYTSESARRDEGKFNKALFEASQDIMESK